MPAPWKFRLSRLDRIRIAPVEAPVIVPGDILPRLPQVFLGRGEPPTHVGFRLSRSWRPIPKGRRVCSLRGRSRRGAPSRQERCQGRPPCYGAGNGFHHIPSNPLSSRGRRSGTPNGSCTAHGKHRRHAPPAHLPPSVAPGRQRTPYHAPAARDRTPLGSTAARLQCRWSAVAAPCRSHAPSQG